MNETCSNMFDLKRREGKKCDLSAATNSHIVKANILKDVVAAAARPKCRESVTLL